MSRTYGAALPCCAVAFVCSTHHAVPTSRLYVCLSRVYGRLCPIHMSAALLPGSGIAPATVWQD